MKHEALIKRLETTCFGLDPIDPLRLLVDDVVAALAQPTDHSEQHLDMVKAQPAQPEQEPVGINGLTKAEEDATASVRGLINTTPPQRTWVGLTDEEKSELWEISRAAWPRYVTYASLAEAKLKQKNT